MEIRPSQIPSIALMVALNGSNEIPFGITCLENAQDGQGCSCKYQSPLALQLPDQIKTAILESVTKEPQFHWFVFKTFTRVVVYKVDKHLVLRNCSVQTIQAALRGATVRRSCK